MNTTGSLTPTSELVSATQVVHAAVSYSNNQTGSTYDALSLNSLLANLAVSASPASVRKKPPKEPPKIAVTSASEFRTLMDGGATAYADLDVRGDSSSLPADHPVIAALHERLRSGSSPGARDDGMRIALAIEGGGMRGSVAAENAVRCRGASV